MRTEKNSFRDMLHEPVIRLIVVHVFFIILTSFLVFCSVYIADKYYEVPLQLKIENQNNKRKLALVLVRKLLEIENDYKSMLLFENSHRAEYYKKKILSTLDRVDSLIVVLTKGGTYSDTMLVNFYDYDAIYEELMYSEENPAEYNVFIIDLKPKIDEIKNTVVETSTLLINKGSWKKDYDLIFLLKKSESLIHRTMESANRLFYDINQANKESFLRIEDTRAKVKYINTAISTASIIFVVILAFIISVKIYAIVRAKRIIQTHNQWLSAVVEQSPSSIVITDSEGLVEYVNPYFEKVTGYHFSEVKGQSTNLLKSGNTPDEVFTELWSTITSGGTWRGELCSKAKDGHLLYEETVIAPVLDLEGNTVNYSAVKLDVTQRNALADNHVQLQFEQEQLKAILNHVPFGVVMVDIANREILWINQYAGELAGSDVLAGERCNVLFGQCSSDSCVALTGQGFQCQEATLLTVGGTIPILKTVQRLTWFNMDAALVTFFDVSHQKRLEAEIAQKSKMESVGSLAAGIAHELNTPIQYINHNLFYLQQTIEELIGLSKTGEITTESSSVQQGELSEEVLSAISDSLEGAKRIAGLVKELKEFSHPGVGKFERIDFNRLTANAISVCCNEWKYVSTVDFAPDEDLPLLQCDPSAIQQVLLNLVVNARDAIADRIKQEKGFFGSIVLSTCLRDNKICLIVEDDGIGIAQENLERVFDPFFTTKLIGQGTGQGLYICRNIIVEKHTGEISIKSEIGRGTKVAISLPVDQS